MMGDQQYRRREYPRIDPGELPEVPPGTTLCYEGDLQIVNPALLNCKRRKRLQRRRERLQRKNLEEKVTLPWE